MNHSKRAHSSSTIPLKTIAQVTRELYSVDTRCFYGIIISKINVDLFLFTALHRYDISDKVWSLLEPHLSGQQRQWGEISYDNRRFINAVFWILRTGAPWRDLPPEYGNWNSVAKQFRRWVEQDVRETILERIIDGPNYEWLIIDASHVKVHPHAAGAVGGNQDMERTKGGSTQRYIWPWMRMVCWSEYLLQRVPLLIVRKDVP
jgi:transposase